MHSELSLLGTSGGMLDSSGIKRESKERNLLGAQETSKAELLAGY